MAGIVYSPEAVDDLLKLRSYLREVMLDPTSADEAIESIMAHCERIAVFPQAGRPRDDLRPGLRTTTFRKRTVIAYAATKDSQPVILGIFASDQDYEGMLRTHMRDR